MSGGRCLAVSGGFSGSYVCKTFMWPFHVAAWLSHSMMAGFQGQESQENQVEAVLHFMNWSWESHNIISTVAKSLPRFKKKEHKPHLLVKRCQCHLTGRAYRMVCIGTVIFGKYKGRLFRIDYLVSMTMLTKDCSVEHLYQ